MYIIIIISSNSMSNFFPSTKNWYYSTVCFLKNPVWFERRWRLWRAWQIHWHSLLHHILPLRFNSWRHSKSQFLQLPKPSALKKSVHDFSPNIQFAACIFWFCMYIWNCVCNWVCFLGLVYEGRKKRNTTSQCSLGELSGVV